MLPASARLSFMQWIVRGGMAVLELTPDCAPAMLSVLQRYRDRPMDLADASLVVLAERLGVDEVLTIDRAEFDVYRLSNGGRFVQVLGSL